MWLLVSACSLPPNSPVSSAEVSSARVREPHLEVTTIESGGSTGIRLAFGAPGARVRVYAGDAVGAGPCPALLQGGCFGVTNPAKVAEGVVEADGTAGFRVTSPSVVGMDVALQAVVEGAPSSLSNVVPRTVIASAGGGGPLGSNVLIVLFDDVGTDKLGLYGSPNPTPTPTLDNLAAEGVVFDTAYSRPVCVPGRAALQTGRFGRRTGVGLNWTEADPWELGLEQLTLAEMVRLSPYYEYDTALVGKWHLGSFAAQHAYGHPGLQGYRYYAGTFANLSRPQANGLLSYFDWEKVLSDGSTVRTQTYATTDTIDDAIGRIAAMPEPWLLVVALNAAHEPFESPPAALMPTAPNPGPGELAREMVAAADTELGRLFGAMTAGQRNRTTVIVTSDNGSHEAEVQPPIIPDRAKGTLFDGGVRVPLIVSGAGVHAPGTRSAAMVDLVDVFPTVAELAGVDLGTITATLDGGAPLALDGVSLVPYLSDPTLPSVRPYLYSELFSPIGPGPYTEVDRATIRDERYKLIVDRLIGLEMFFEYVPGADDEGPNLLPCGLTPEQDAAYQRLRGSLADETAALVYDADPVPPPANGFPGFPLDRDTGAVSCSPDTGP
ncbi:MAG: sulfatase-like hydrolase/transferase [Myxococcota bacterium]